VKYLLDTNVLIQLLRPRNAPPILERLGRLADDDAVTCSIVRLELIAGALRSQRPDHHVARAEELLSTLDSLPLDDRAATQAGHLRASLERAGTPIGPNDLLIAGIALAHGLTLVTHNSSEFARVTGLHVEDWQRSD
jgi:tRNA(fMet)-specific endonuclease VapC